MSTSIITRPEVLVDTGFTSRFVSVGHSSNKANFTFHRNDSQYISLRQGDNSNLVINATSNISNQANVGGNIFVRNVASYGDVTGNILAVVDGRTTQIITDIPYIDDQNGALATDYINFSSNNYQLKIFIYHNVTGRLLSSTIQKTSPSGYIYFNASPYLRSRLKAEYQNPGQINFDNTNLSIPFYLKWQITYQGTEEAIQNDAIVYTAIFASMRIRDKFGECMGEHTSFNTNLVESKKGKFLTRFTEPTYFPNYPFTLSFLYEGTSIPYKEEVFKNNSSLSVGGTSDQLLSTSDFKYQQTLNLIGGYGENVKCISVYLSQDGTEIGCLALDDSDFILNPILWYLDESDVLQYIELKAKVPGQILTIDTYPDLLLYNPLNQLVETIVHNAGLDRYVPGLTHILTPPGVWRAEWTDISVTLAGGTSGCLISLEQEVDSSTFCGIDFDSIELDLIVYPNI